MKSSTEFYTEKMYPLQDGVLKIVRDLRLPFYLTGGTALSRHFLGHRYSDDIDLFVNADNQFSTYVERIIAVLTEEPKPSPLEIIRESIVSAPAYARLYVAGYGTQLKVDLVNDLPLHFGDFELAEPLGRIDNWRNILSNKISALFRFSEKDYVDVWALAKKFGFQWKQIMQEAKHKEASVEPGEISNLFKSFPFDRLDTIKWAEGFDYSKIRDDFQVIAEDLFYGKDNSLR